MTQALMSSCNDALMQMARDYIKPDVFCRYQKIFGLGQSTGIDLPGEAEGILHAEETMGSTDLATNSFGQNFNVTMIQMAAAYCSLLNGGYYYEPRMVKQILDEDGNVVKNLDPVLVRRTISEHTSEFIKEALFQVVEGGTGQKAAIPGYEMGGKTGTGEKYPRGDEKYIISFVACIPAHNPELFIYTLIDEPQYPQTVREQICDRSVQGYIGGSPSLFQYISHAGNSCRGTAAGRNTAGRQQSRQS